MSGNGKVKCKCGREFKTQASLQQHKLSGSCRSKPVPKAQRSRFATDSPMGAPVAQAVSIRESGTDTATVAGVDRISHIEDVSKYNHGVVVIDELVSASSFSRLARVAGAYQKIRFRKLVFRVVPMVSTAVGGGYVVAFVRDPSDLPPTQSLALLNWATSQQGSVTTKWWQSASVAAAVSDRTYYTSSSEEVREYSPGRLVVVVDGKSTSPGPMTIFADWSVTLTQASLESAVSPSRPDHTNVLRNIWTKDTNRYCWSYDSSKSDDSGSPNPDTMFSDWAVDDLFMLSSAFTLLEYKTGTTGDGEVENFWVLHVESITGVRWRIHPDTTDSGKAAADNVLVVPRGAVLRRVEKSEVFSENLMRRGSFSGIHKLSPLGREPRPSQRFCENSEISSKKSEICSVNESQPGIPQQVPVGNFPLELAGLMGSLTELLQLLRSQAESSAIQRQESLRGETPFSDLGVEDHAAEPDT